MPGTSYVKKGMAAETQEEDDELTDIKEGDIINLQNLLFTEKRDYLVKYNGQKVCTVNTECSLTTFYLLYQLFFKSYFPRQHLEIGHTILSVTTHFHILLYRGNLTSWNTERKYLLGMPPSFDFAIILFLVILYCLAKCQNPTVVLFLVLIMWCI